MTFNLIRFIIVIKRLRETSKITGGDPTPGGIKMKTVIECRKNHEHIVGNEWKEEFDQYDEGTAKRETLKIADEYEASINADGHEMDDQDDMNNDEAVRNLVPGEYDFDCGDFTYYVTITE